MSDAPANPGGLVYGTILVATLLAAESPRRETYLRTIGAVVVALALYWLANAYATYTGDRMRRSDPFAFAGFARAARHEVTVVVGALAPLLAVLVCWAAGASLSTAVSIGIWTAVAMIVATEVLLGLRAELEGREMIIQTGIGLALGLLVIALRVLLH